MELGANSRRRERNKLETVISCAAALCLLFPVFWIILKYIPHVFSSEKTQANELEVRGWEKGVSRDPTKYIDSSKDTTIISGREICKNSSTTFVIVVTTHPSNFSKRALIRETWASLKVDRVKLGFLVGLTRDGKVQSSLEEESARFHDIIQENLVDSYNNLTLKSISLLKWYLRRCPVSSILLKADDDTFIDVEMLVSRLAEYSNRRGILEGCLCKTANVIRNVRNKWYVPEYMFKGNVYPDYLSGSAYFMSWDVATRLYSAALETPIFHFEDVYITGICAQKAEVKPRVFNGFSVYVNNVESNCLPHHVTCHPVCPKCMRSLWAARRNKSDSSKSKTEIHSAEILSVE